MLSFIYPLALAGATMAEPENRVNKPVPPGPMVPREVFRYPPPPPPTPVAKGKAKPPRPKNSPGGWLIPGDYPDDAIRNLEQGATVFTLTISRSGKVVKCVVISSSGSSLLDATTCARISERAIFEPALDSKGNRTLGSYSNSVVWKFPRMDDLEEGPASEP